MQKLPASIENHYLCRIQFSQFYRAPIILSRKPHTLPYTATADRLYQMAAVRPESRTDALWHQAIIMVA
jgi:hypothetical protein